MNNSEKYKTIRAHGQTGEKKARRWLKKQAPDAKIIRLNDTLDLLTQDTYIEVKTCTNRITDPKNIFGRAGRFTFEQAQHEELCRLGGCYLFVILHERSPSIIFLCRACNIPFHKQLAYTTTLKYRKLTDINQFMPPKGGEK